MSVGNQIRKRRKQLKITQDELAKLTGYGDKTAISKIELGQRDLTQSKIVLFANALQTTPAYLLGLTEEPTKGYGLTFNQTLIERFENSPEDTKKAICLLLGIDHAHLQR